MKIIVTRALEKHPRLCDGPSHSEQGALDEQDSVKDDDSLQREREGCPSREPSDLQGQRCRLRLDLSRVQASPQLQPRAVQGRRISPQGEARGPR